MEENKRVRAKLLNKTINLMQIAKFEGNSVNEGARIGGISFINKSFFFTYLHNILYVWINKGALSLTEGINKSTIPAQTILIFAKHSSVINYFSSFANYLAEDSIKYLQVVQIKTMRFISPNQE